jgi:hypothetical protein
LPVDQSAALADVAKPRKAAKRKDKLSKAFFGIRGIRRCLRDALGRKPKKNKVFGVREQGCEGRPNKKTAFAIALAATFGGCSKGSTSPRPILWLSRAFSDR